MMIETAQILFLHGASSSGKSTLARALQDALPLPFWHISIDHLRDSGVLPSKRFKSGEFDWQLARQCFFDGYHRSLKAYASAGNHLILEHILDEEGWFDQLVRLFEPFEVLFIGLHCPIDILEAREKARGDRPRGSAVADYHSIHKGLRYDLELDALEPLEENVETVIAAWRQRIETGDIRRSVFRQQLERLGNQNQ
ncbi:chloramphenicol 3-O phosphotransferase [Cohaesibacter sp. ES.047]|uniref:chloramphenicol phosphotransferase CPT family protein n=1 Tax=Cohaesibacter sp. ES.047 TaxID=1798205 RepID=UPI000BC04CCF|nr:AAA family ATPase [Cohaesibacter sp. ES.047]SNY90371.1 chloramphenicol 3-O phosphotransferase [Cohaesibacter sp. ES.047]